MAGSTRKQGEKPIEGHLADLGSDPGTLSDRDRQQIALLVHRVLTERVGILIKKSDGLHFRDYRTRNSKRLSTILAEIALDMINESRKDDLVKVLVRLEEKGVIIRGPNFNSHR
jgi:hypothetical protein